MPRVLFRLGGIHGNPPLSHETLYLNPGNIAGYHSTLDYSSNRPFVLSPDYLWSRYSIYFRQLLLQEISYDTLAQLYPELITESGGIHITGEEFATTEDLMVIGLAVCPTIFTDTDSMRLIAHIIDTSIANRLTEYVQLYTLNGGVPLLRAQGPWR